MTSTKLFALATAAALLPTTAFAQAAQAETTGCCARDADGRMTCCDEDGDGTMDCCAKMKARAGTSADAGDHRGMDHGSMAHSTMDHGTMDHGAMNHGSMTHPPAKPEPVSPSSADRPSAAH